MLEEIAKISTRKLEEKKRAIVHYYFVFTAGLQGWALRYKPVFGCCSISFRVVPRKDQVTSRQSSVMLLQRLSWDSYHLLCFSCIIVFFSLLRYGCLCEPGVPEAIVAFSDLEQRP